MGLGALATIGVQRPQQPRGDRVRQRRLRRDRHAAEPHRSAASISPRVARAAGFAACLDVADEAGLRDLAARLKAFRARRCSPASRSRPTIRRACCRSATASRIKRRFRAALGLTEA